MTITETELDDVFHALSNRTRRRLLSDLSRSPARVGELAKPYDMSLNAISKHLFVLERAGLIRRQQDDGVQTCFARVEPMLEAGAWIEAYHVYWTSQLDVLANFVEARQKS